MRDLGGREGVIEIVDSATGPWGHVNVDRISLCDELPESMRRPNPRDLTYGTMALAFLGDARAGPGASGPGDPIRGGPDESVGATPPVGWVAAPFELGPGAECERVFLVCWHFPNLHTGEGVRYAERFEDALAVARFAREHDARLRDATMLFRKTYYEGTTLPWWLALRLMMPTSILATGTCQWWRDGRFWGWEGVGCCHGTCTHVWNYSHAEARLFPALARSARTMQDLGTAFEENTGRVAFRGEVRGGFDYAADGQAGTVLKCYREHLCSPDASFLNANWPRIRMVVEHLLTRDAEPPAKGAVETSGAEADGIIVGTQHNTFDINFHGPNTFVGSLYLAALLAGARMAEAMGDNATAARYRGVYARGREWTEKNLFNGRYFIQRVPEGESDRFQYADGCLSDQTFGQTWARLLDLGPVYDPGKVRRALMSVYRHNFAPAVGAYNAVHPPERVFADPREPGLFVCTWPEGKRPDEPVRYRDEVWTGIEYQVAAGLAAEGLVDQALVLVRAVDSRYDGAVRNPWNEVECGDHYSRAMAAWGVLQAITGFVYDGPAGVIGMSPRLTPDRFAAFFAGAEGWGTLSQGRLQDRQINRIDVRHGALRVARFVAEMPVGILADQVRCSLRTPTGTRRLTHTSTGQRAEAATGDPLVLRAGEWAEFVWEF